MPITRFRTIRSRLLAILLLATCAVVGIGAAVWRFTLVPALQRAAVDTQSEIARQAAEEISDFLERRVAELETAKQIGRFWEAQGKHQRATLDRLLKQSPAIQKVSVTDPAGREILWASRTGGHRDGASRSLEGEEAFLRGIRGEVYLGPVVYDRTTESFMTVAVPVRFTATEIRGVLIAAVSLKTLWDTITHFPVGQTGHAFVVDQGGVLIAHPDRSKVLTAPTMARVPKVRDFLTSSARDPRPGTVDVGESGKKVLTTFAMVPRPRWAVIVEEPVETALQGLRRVERLAILLTLLTLAGAVAVSWGFSERIARPIRQLKEGATRIARGDLDHTLAIHTGDEIEELAAQFNHMAAEVRASRRDLEQKVAEKTRDLSALYALTGPIGRASELQGVIDDAVGKIMSVTGADAAAIRLLDQEDGRFFVASYRGFPESYVRKVSVRGPQNAVSEEVVTTGTPTISENLLEDPRFTRALLVREGFRSAAHVPLRSSEGVIGIMTLASREPGRIAPRQAELFQAVAHQMSIAIENARLVHLERERRRQVEAVRAVTEEITRELDITKLLELIHRRAAELVGATSGVVYLWDQAAEILIPEAWYGFGEWMRGVRLRLGETLAGAIAERREGIIVNDYRRSPYTNPLFVEQGGITACLGEPLIYRDKLLGVITVNTKDEGQRFTEHDRQLLALFAAQAAIAIENARLYEEGQRRAREATALADVGRALSESLDMDRVLDRIAVEVRQMTEAAFVGVMRLDEARQELSYVAGVGLPRERFAPLRVKVGEWIAGQAAAQRAAIHVPDLLADPRVTSRGIIREEGYRSFVCVPLMAGDRVLGTINISRREAGQFTPAEVQLLTRFADQAAIAIENARLYAEVHRHSQELEQKVEERTREVEAANRAKSDLLAHMSHELRTPLNAIIGFAEMLKMGTSGALEPKQERYVDNIRNGGRHLLKIVNDVLDLAKVEAGRLELSVERVPLARAIGEALDHVRLMAGEKALVLTCEAGPDLPDVQADPLRLQQILVNLLSNAIKFTPETGQVTVCASRAPAAGPAHDPRTDWVELSVRDSGVGIAPEDLGRLFRQFEQVHKNRDGKGTGLGLALTRHLVELHEGTITVHSDGPGQGSTFTVRLPGLPSRESPHVLLVADDPETVSRLEEAIRQWGWTVTPTRTVGASRAALAETTPDLLILDPDLEGGSGLDLVWEMRQKRASAAPILLLAGSASARRQAAMAAGADDCLDPAAPPEMIQERAGRLLERCGWPPLMLGLPTCDASGRLEYSPAERAA